MSKIAQRFCPLENLYLGMFVLLLSRGTQNLQTTKNLFLDFHLIDKVVDFHIFLEVRRPPKSLDQ